VSCFGFHAVFDFVGFPPPRGSLHCVPVLARLNFFLRSHLTKRPYDPLPTGGYPLGCFPMLYKHGSPLSDCSLHGNFRSFLFWSSFTPLRVLF